LGKSEEKDQGTIIAAFDGMEFKNFGHNGTSLNLHTKGGHAMNKGELIDYVSGRAEVTKKDAEKAINAVLDGIQGALADGDKVQLVGFGTFEVRERSARKGRNPQTGQTIDIPASKVPAFKGGKMLKEAIEHK